MAHVDAQGMSETDARREATARLFTEMTHAGEEQRQRLREEVIRLNMPVATSIAMRYRGRGESIDDLVQVASLGLVKAVDGYDPGRGRDFLAYAVPTISGEVKRHFRDRGWDIRPPRRIQELRASVEAAQEVLVQRLDRSPTVSEVARYLDVDIEDVTECLASVELYHVRSVDQQVDSAGELSLAETLGGPDPRLEHVVDSVSLRPLLKQLPPRDKRILSLRFDHGWTQSQIADDVGVTQMQVSRLLSQVLAKLRRQLDAEAA
ncbi:SigB/SigF/SigG family RNA polymerase sigma factor [Kineococcus xinjiangensis]|uniref:SigB/SigF/SigG family RNA polymerase sigma factor n=1 Tax=Kineococcus xinjiangensis TaxID=512762 RepID=UPI001B802068|nr:SigB/SigF/SigG family RNA polymerase sigma factor [Kineococcus xinjiangensis]